METKEDAQLITDKINKIFSLIREGYERVERRKEENDN